MVWGLGEKTPGYRIKCSKLNRSNNIRFVASELIFEKGSHRVDIVGYDKEDIYFFELKRARTTRVEQVLNYVHYYESNRSFLEELLRNYPIHPVKNFKNIKGYMVMAYCEDERSRNELKEKAEKSKVGLLFFSPAFRYQAICNS